MILTIKAPTKGLLKQGVWQASVNLGLDVEEYADGTFDVICHSDKDVKSILAKSNGSVIYQR